MKNQITIFCFAFCCLLATALNSCNNKPAAQSETVVKDSTAEENPLKDGDDYIDPPAVTVADTTTIHNDGLVFIELSGKAIDGATYVVKSGDRTITQGTSANGGKFTADLQKGQTYQVTASARGYKDQTKTITCTGEPIKVGMK